MCITYPYIDWTDNALCEVCPGIYSKDIYVCDRKKYTYSNAAAVAVVGGVMHELEQQN